MLNMPMTSGSGSTTTSRTSLNIFVFGLAVFVRTLLGFHPHSGEGEDHQNAAAYGGDYEAQRHWMEVTLHLPLEQWYTYDLNYWGLDYPPLTAYVSYFCGYLSQLFLGPTPTALVTSRGYEDPTHKAFLRATVLTLDVLVYFTSVYALTSKMYPKYNNNKNHYQTLISALLQPAILLIDHGHFQYNTVALGFALWTFYFLAQGTSGHNTTHNTNSSNDHSPYIIASVFFCLSLNFKQISLYYAPVVFAFLLGRCLQSNNFVLFFQLAATVIFTFTLLWAPFYYFNNNENKMQYLMHIVQRIFPFHRGLFENKVANLWCALSTKPLSIRKRIPQEYQPVLSSILTFAMILPPCIILFLVGKNGTKQQQSTRLLLKQILLGATACALAFFLAGFQVHEKSILFPLAPISALFMEDPKFILWFSMVAVWSLFPLMILDKLQLAYFCYCIFYLVIAQSVLSLNLPARCMSAATKASSMKIARLMRWITYKLVIPASGFIMILLHVSEKIIRPPPFHLPDLFPVLWSITGCAMFIWSYLYYLTLLCETVYCSPADCTASLSPEETMGKKRKLGEEGKKKEL